LKVPELKEAVMGLLHLIASGIISIYWVCQLTTLRISLISNKLLISCSQSAFKSWNTGGSSR